MMKVRMKTRYANGTLAIEPDQVGDLPTAEAKDLIEKGYALPVDEDPSHGAVSAPAKKQSAAAKKAAEQAAKEAADAQEAARLVAEEAAKKADGGS